MMDDIPLKPKGEEDNTPQAWNLKPDEPTPKKLPPPPAEDKTNFDDDDDVDEGLLDEGASLLDEFKTILGDRRCKQRLGPRILKFLYPIMMLGFAPFACIVFEMAVLKYSGLIAAVMVLPVAVALLFIQFFVYRVGFEMAYAILGDHK